VDKEVVSFGKKNLEEDIFTPTQFLPGMKEGARENKERNQ